jgi:hypothetical protein
MQTFEFDFHPRYRPLLRALGVTAENSHVAITDDRRFVARFGSREVSTPLGNISCIQRSGGYRWFKAIGIRGSLADGGLTFGSTTTQGVCVRFAEPIPALLPGMRTHPGLTVTVADADGLVAALEGAPTSV